MSDSWDRDDDDFDVQPHAHNRGNDNESVIEDDDLDVQPHAHNHGNDNESVIEDD